MKEPRAIVIFTVSESLDSIVLRSIKDILVNDANAETVMISEYSGQDLSKLVMLSAEETSGKSTKKRKAVRNRELELIVQKLHNAYDYLMDQTQGAFAESVFPTLPIVIKYHTDASMRTCCEILSKADNAAIEEWIHRYHEPLRDIQKMRRVLENAKKLYEVMQ